MLPADATSYDATGLSGNVDYYYRVHAYAGVQRSIDSNVLGLTAANSPPTMPVLIAPADGAGTLQQPIGKSALAVVDVGDDAEISYQLSVKHSGRGLQVGCADPPV